MNASPSYIASCREDYEMKFRLLEDTLNVVDVERRWRCDRSGAVLVEQKVEISIHVRSADSLQANGEGEAGGRV